MKNPGIGNTGLKRLWNALHCSLAGFDAACKNEAAFRQELLLALVLIPVAMSLPMSAMEKALMIACVLLALIVKLLNSAIEAAVDRISLGNHELSKRAKDRSHAEPG